MVILVAIIKVSRYYWWKLIIVKIWLYNQLLDLVSDKFKGIAFFLSFLKKNSMKWNRIEIFEFFCKILQAVHESENLDTRSKTFKKSVSSCRSSLSTLACQYPGNSFFLFLTTDNVLMTKSCPRRTGSDTIIVIDKMASESN